MTETNYQHLTAKLQSRFVSQDVIQDLILHTLEEPEQYQGMSPDQLINVMLIKARKIANRKEPLVFVSEIFVSSPEPEEEPEKEETPLTFENLEHLQGYFSNNSPEKYLEQLCSVPVYGSLFWKPSHPVLHKFGIIFCILSGVTSTQAIQMTGARERNAFTLYRRIKRTLRNRKFRKFAGAVKFLADNKLVKHKPKHINRARQIAQYSLDGKLLQLYDSSSQVSKAGYNRRNVHSVLTGVYRTTGGFIWRYYEICPS
jgi:hypothetical protein